MKVLTVTPIPACGVKVKDTPPFDATLAPNVPSPVTYGRVSSVSTLPNS